MKAAYLGDCLDYYKRWFLTSFFGESVASIPMITGDWSDADTRAYESLLSLKVLTASRFPNGKPEADQRRAYFNAALEGAAPGQTIFLDPNTGVPLNTPSMKKSADYLFLAEIRAVVDGMNVGSTCVVYDHSVPRGKVIPSVSEKLDRLKKAGLNAFAYCAQVAMLAVSRDPERLRAAISRAESHVYVRTQRIRTNF